MQKVILDTTLREKLRNLSEPLELCDESGRVLGRVLPAYDPAAYEGLQPSISREEIERRKQAKDKAYTTAEVLAQMEKL